MSDKRIVTTLAALLVAVQLLAAGCADRESPSGGSPRFVEDAQSHSNPAEVLVRNLELDLSVDFELHRLSGRATLHLENRSGSRLLRLDTRDLLIEQVVLDSGREAGFELGEEIPYLGRALSIDIQPDTRLVHIDYSTSPEAEALQWLEPAQTAGGRHPALFSQSQAILARTWVPCQDTPSVRTTYEARITVSPGLIALMSAENPTRQSADGVYRFSMPQPIPSYLLALAVGDFEFRSLGPRTGVYAEPELIEAAAWEFAQVEAMMEATEGLYGPYRWGRYDLLVLPPSFPFGGMENPRLTFATPTILAGDRSLVALVAHELAHSWSGNLVTNATWNDFWLNEGFTSYLENRIMEELEGADHAEMLRALSLQTLREELEELGADSPDTHLALDLSGRNPDDAGTAIAYDKGAALLRLLEETVGRERWDAFLLLYFDSFAFQSLDTDRFEAFLRKHLLAELPDGGEALQLDSWLHGPGLPANFPYPQSDAFATVEEQIASWRRGTPATELATGTWSPHEWLHFLRNLPDDATSRALAELDAAFGFTDTGNSEILTAWLTLAIRRGYEPARPVLLRFLESVGRTKFLKPLYTELAASEEGLAWAREVYAGARDGYHPLTRGTIDKILGWSEPATVTAD